MASRAACRIPPFFIFKNIRRRRARGRSSSKVWQRRAFRVFRRRAIWSLLENNRRPALSELPGRVHCARCAGRLAGLARRLSRQAYTGSECAERLDAIGCRPGAIGPSLPRAPPSSGAKRSSCPIRRLKREILRRRLRAFQGCPIAFEAFAARIFQMHDQRVIVDEITRHRSMAAAMRSGGICLGSATIRSMPSSRSRRNATARP